MTLIQTKLQFSTDLGNDFIDDVSNCTAVPDGFYTLPVRDLPRSGDNRNENICNFCDARKLCNDNKDNWCQKYRCMTSDVLLKDGSILKGRKEFVVFKRLS